MSLQLPRYRMRLACDALSHGSLHCLLQDRSPIVWRGVDMQVEAGLFWGSTLTDDIDNITTLTAEIHDNSDRAGAPLVQKTLAVVGLKTDLTLEEWQGGAADNAHGVFEFSDEDMQLDMTDAVQNIKTFWLVIHAVTADTYRNTYAAGTFDIEEDGAQNDLSVVTSPTPTAKLSTTGDIYIYNPDTERYHRQQATGPVGAVTVAYEQQGVLYADIP